MGKTQLSTALPEDLPADSARNRGRENYVDESKTGSNLKTKKCVDISFSYKQ